MKKIIILSGIAVLLTLSAGAQADQSAIRKDEQALNKEEKHIRHEKKEERKELRKLKGKEVDERAKDQFRNDFPGITADVWRREGAFDVAQFVKDRVSKSAFYDYDATLVGTTEKKTFADLPEKARMHIIKKYVGYTIGDVILFDDNKSNESDMILYGHQFADADNYFVELIKGDKKIVLKADPGGQVSYFSQIR